MAYEKGTSPIDCIKNRLKGYITRFDINIFFCAFVFSLIVHLFMFTNKLINHDDIDGLYSDCGFGLSSGRWLLHALTVITGSFSSSWFDGVLGAIFLSLAAVLIIRFLKITRYLPACLAVFALVAFPTVASTYAYMFNAAQYLFALFLSVLGAHLIRRGDILSMSAGAVLIACAMGCYQSYFCMSAILLVIAVMTDLLDGKYKDWKELILTALKYVGFLALGMVLYFIILKVCLWVTGTELVSYKGMDEMGAITISQLLERVKAAYLNFGGYYLNVKGIYNKLFPILSLSALAVTFIAVIRSIIKNGIHKKPITLIISALIVIIFPFGCFLAYLMAETGDVHQLMLYPAVLPLILPCVVLDRLTFSGKKVKDRAVMALATMLIALQVLIAYEFAFVTNRAYFYMGMTYENAYAYFTKLSAKIEMTDGFEKDTHVALLGYATMDTVVPDSNMTGVITGNTALNMYTRTTFMHYFLGSAYHYATPEEKDAIMASEEYAAMPCYPESESIKVINGIITVKFS